MSGYSLPVPSWLKKGDVWKLAERTAGRLGFEIGDSLEPVVNALGGKIVFREAVGTSEKPESIIVRSDDDFTIFLGNITSWERDRFTIAHELGHLFIHYPLAKLQDPTVPMKATRWVDEADEDQTRAEWEANWFSAAFLMPAAKFKSVYRSMNEKNIAAQFAVSLAAVRNRAKSLSLSD